jgi:hypothetical protein
MTAPDATASPAAFARFVAARFGAHHHVVSLVRLGLLLHDGRVPATECTPRSYDPAVPYLVGADVHILMNMHDPQVGMDRIADIDGSTAPLPGTGLPDGSVIVRLGTRPPAVYTVDAGVAAMLELFGEPRRPDDVVRALAATSQQEAATHQVFRHLASQAILVPCVDEQTGYDEESI